MTEMNAEESRILGGLQSAMEEHGRQLGKLFEKSDEIALQLTRMNGSVSSHVEKIASHETRISRLERVFLKAILVALILAFGGATGITAIKEFLLK